MGLATPWRVLALVSAAQFMVVLDISVVNVALPSIQLALGFDPAALQWVVNSYALLFAGFLLLGGRLADIYGRRRIFLMGLALFTASSLVGGLAASPGTLVAARAAQGLGAAILAPATLTILTTSFPEGPERTRALAVWTAVGIAGGTAGNIIGGLLTQYLSWRWVLLINVPIGALAILLGTRLLAADRARESGHRLDLPGAALATGGLVALTYGIAQTRSHGWGSPVTLIALAAGVTALAAFVLVEARFARSPLMPLDLFRLRTIATGNAAMLLAGACLNPMWFFLTLYMQRVLDYSPVQTGAAFLPHTVVTMLVGIRLTPRLMEHFESRALIATGALLAAAGFLWQSRITPDSSYLSGILGPAIVFSVGGGLLITPITATVTSGVDEADAGAASGLMNTTKQVGGALGLAALVAIGGSDVRSAETLTAGYSREFLAMAAILVLVVAVALTLPAGAASTAPASTDPGHDRQPCQEAAGGVSSQAIAHRKTARAVDHARIDRLPDAGGDE